MHVQAALEENYPASPDADIFLLHVLDEHSGKNAATHPPQHRPHDESNRQA
jgi:hypothetical protein